MAIAKIGRALLCGGRVCRINESVFPERVRSVEPGIPGLWLAQLYAGFADRSRSVTGFCRHRITGHREMRRTEVENQVCCLPSERIQETDTGEDSDHAGEISEFCLKTSSIQEKPSTDRRLGAMLALLSGAYLALQLRDGWIPADEGSLGQSAERVLHGEIPHRDFNELYTGGLSYLHAAAFEAFGVDMFVLRVVLLVAFIGWVYLLYRVARHFMPRLTSVIVVALGVTWSVPNYPGPIPSWYNLFLATACLYAILEYITGRSRVWIFLGGLAAGLSLAVKIVGLYLVAAVVFFALYHSQSASPDRWSSNGSRMRPLPLLTIAAISVGVLGPALLVLRSGSPENLIRFVFPIVCIGTVVAVDSLIVGQKVRGGALQRLGAIAIPFSLGLALPVLVLSMYYARHEAFTDLVAGVFIRPSTRISLAALPAFASLSAIPTLVVLAWMWLGARSAGRRLLEQQLVQLALLLALGVSAAQSVLATAAIWSSVYHLGPAVVAIGSAVLLRDQAVGIRNQALYLLLSVTAFTSLTQFPYAGPIHFYATAPMVFLSAAAVAHTVWDCRTLARTALLPVGFFVLFAVLLLNRPLGLAIRPGPRLVPLDNPRASLRVPIGDSVRYARIGRLIDSLGAKRLEYAGPDAPEVFFLTGTGYPSPHLFEFLDPERGTAARIVESLEDSAIVVLNYRPTYSTATFFATDSGAFQQRFPESAEVDGFVVRWK